VAVAQLLNVRLNMSIIVLPLILVVLVLWFYAEFKLGRRARIILGLIVMLCSGFLVYAFCQVRPFYESSWHRNSIRDAESLLKQGQTNLVISAFETYTSIAATDSTFRASERMMHVLESGQTK
jgi:hypothetical protein